MSSPTQGMWACRHGTDGRDFCPECYEPVPPPWPWRELDELSAGLYEDLCEGTSEIMRKAGEDDGNVALFRIRCAQVAEGIASRARKDRDRS